MKKNAYHYLFGQDTLYQADEPEPVHREPVLPGPPVSQPEITVDQVEVEPEIEPVRPEVMQPVAIIQPVAVVEPVLPLVASAEPETVPSPVPIIESNTPGPLPQKPKVLILIDEELTPGELIFLENILKAIHLNLNEIDILNLAGSGLVDFHAVLENKTLHHFISFGVPFKTIHLNIQMDRYQPIRIFGITFLLADPLSAIEADSKLKRKLWEVLKKVFLD
ncbi:hypothetical protein GCM10028803_05900 [Larkinella knui]|uniref:Uncharacterized protein n=1 Tax=Larkinella knui TaxID=2025310 RepID=A0A3P1CKC2_9BACT|nr:hypothetical protein [Larkinella knui]RRB13735.1 hypothetical protein EHT87_15860 [Larkinella knui]